MGHRPQTHTEERRHCAPPGGELRNLTHTSVDEMCCTTATNMRTQQTHKEKYTQERINLRKKKHQNMHIHTFGIKFAQEA